MNHLLYLILLVVVSLESLSGQSAVDRILKAYPNWRTNFEKSSIDLEELKIGRSAERWNSGTNKS
jgi:hypothetical protein